MRPDPMGEAHREDYVAPTGTVYLDPSKTVNDMVFHPEDPTTACIRSHRGSLHIGLYGVTVTAPDGSSWMYPWRVVQAVQIDPVNAPGDSPRATT